MATVSLASIFFLILGILRPNYFGSTKSAIIVVVLLFTLRFTYSLNDVDITVLPSLNITLPSEDDLLWVQVLI